MSLIIHQPDYKWNGTLSKRKTTTHCMLHHVAGTGSPMDIHNYHQSLGWLGIGYHIYVRLDGTIYWGRPLEMAGGHTTNWNYCSIGICAEGNFENITMPDVQIKSLQFVVDKVRDWYPGIIIAKHKQYQSTACPGKNYPFDEIVSGYKPIEPSEDPEEPKEPSPWAKDDCEWAVEMGLFQGNGKGDYMWREAVTREELAVFFRRASQL